MTVGGGVFNRGFQMVVGGIMKWVGEGLSDSFGRGYQMVVGGVLWEELPSDERGVCQMW